MPKINSNTIKLLLFLILFLGFLLRAVNLENAPKGLQSDEASFLINSVSIMQTGRDEDDRLFPLYLHSLIDSKPALYSYLQIPFLAIFGVSTAASRLPSAVIGTASIFFFFNLLKKILKDEKLALLGAGLLAISPWHIMNSRATQEVIMSLLFVLANFNIFADIAFKKKPSIKDYCLFFLTLSLAMYSYHSAKIVMIGFYFITFLGKRISSNESRLNGRFLTTFLISLLAFFLTAGSALVRFSAIGIFHNDLPLAYIHEFTTKSTGITPLILIRSFYNKPWLYFHFFLEHYLSHFDLNFLFTIGGATKRFSISHHGLFYVIEAPLMMLGIYQIIKKRKYNALLPLTFLLIILAPIPAALTIEEIPSSIRSFTLILPLTLLTVLGFKYILEKSNRKIYLVALTSILSFCYLWSLSFFLQQFFVIMPIHKPWYRSRPYEITANYIRVASIEDNQVHVASDLREMYIYLWLNDLISIDEIQANPRARIEQRYSIGSYVFDQRQCYFDEVQQGDLLIAPSDCKEKIKFANKTILEGNFDDGEPGFIVLERI